MSEHRARVSWERGQSDFTYETYEREHRVVFEGGSGLSLSAAPDYNGDASRANPEELYAASLSSCHMLTFLAIAARKRFTVDRYEDDCSAIMEKNDDGKIAVTRVVLRPRASFSGEKRPSPEEINRLHDSAHHHCFIANSVRTQIDIEPA